MAKKPANLGWIHTEAHWLNCRDLERMIEFLAERGSPRRWLLFACACCWRILPLLTDERSRHAVSVAERVAEGLASASELSAARTDAELAAVEAYRDREYPRGHASMAAATALYAPRRSWIHAAEAAGSGAGAERAAQCGLLRELFGNPFRPSAFDPAWRTPIVTAIASQIYQREAWEEMPVLGDALEDAGCSDAAALTHCRAGGPHLRGCWVVDGILGKN